MKNFTPKIIGAVLATGLLITAGLARAQTAGITTTTTQTTTEGIVSEISTEGFLIRTKTGEPPVRYISSEKTTYVDEEGKAIAVTTAVVGNPVTVHYTRVGDALVASKIMVRRTLTSPSGSLEAIETVPMAHGTIGEFGSKRIILNPVSPTDPLQYIQGNTTRYVDEAGNPVSLEVVRAGMPVTVYYTRSGKDLIATQVIVRKAPYTPGTVIEKKTTTTTTTTKDQ
jgi:hypothetical protein